MSGIAEVLVNLDFTVTGSDQMHSASVKHLEKAGAKVFIGHAEANVEGADVVVTSTAIRQDNPEVVEAKLRQIPIIRRAEMLAELMRLKHSIAVAGAHGKTTTTSLVATILNEAEMDPTVVIGGKLNSLGSGAKLGTGEYIVAEADESDGSFLSLSPTIAVVTNIDLEHVDHYTGGLAEIKEHFVAFMNKVPFYGAILINIDDPHIQSILPQITKKYVTYGMSSQADIRAEEITQENGVQRFGLRIKGESVGTVEISLCGSHNIYNTLAAITASLELGVEIDVMKTALAKFEGVQRRVELKGEKNGTVVYDDYGHHPTEVKLTLQGVKELFPAKNLVVLFQPHRYSRTLHLLNDFEMAFNDADVVLLLDIYAASEKPLEGISSEILADGIRTHGHKHVEYIAERTAVKGRLNELLDDNSILLTLGAGDVWKEGELFLQG